MMRCSGHGREVWRLGPRADRLTGIQVIVLLRTTADLFLFACIVKLADLLCL